MRAVGLIKTICYKDSDMSQLSSTAMVLAAGYGMRMRPLTLETPKPLLKVGGRAMLDHALDRLVAVGVDCVIVNCFYLADQIEAHLSRRDDVKIIISREAELLDTGGGIKNVLGQFDDKPFIAMNSDLPWFDGETPSLEAMKQLWNPWQMDALILVMQTQKARGFKCGDFALGQDGRLKRRNIDLPKTHVVLGAQIVKPELFAAEKDKIFSNNVIWDKAESRGALFGVEHLGTCYHASTPEDFAEANRLIESGEGWAVT